MTRRPSNGSVAYPLLAGVAGESGACISPAVDGPVEHDSRTTRDRSAVGPWRPSLGSNGPDGLSGCSRSLIISEDPPDPGNGRREPGDPTEPEQSHLNEESEYEDHEKHDIERVEQ